MFSQKRVIADAGYFSSRWAPVVLRFFQLYVGDQPTAEALTIDTLAEHVRLSDDALPNAIVVRLLRRALAKAISVNTSNTQSADPLVSAIIQVEPMRRATIVLFRGLSLDLDIVAKIIGQDRTRTRRICIDALEELHRRLSSFTPEIRVVTDRSGDTLGEAK